MFDDLDDFDDDFEDSMASKQDQDFNANELLNLTDYQNRRKVNQNPVENFSEQKKASGTLNIKEVLNGKAA